MFVTLEVLIMSPYMKIAKSKLSIMPQLVKDGINLATYF